MGISGELTKQWIDSFNHCIFEPFSHSYTPCYGNVTLPYYSSAAQINFNMWAMKQHLKNWSGLALERAICHTLKLILTSLWWAFFKLALMFVAATSGPQQYIYCTGTPSTSPE